jgi:hypothetical protein
VNTLFFTATWGMVSLFSLAAHAQPVSTALPSGTQPPAFQSAFEGYQPHTDDKRVDWKTANDSVARIGGWRAYAKEASAPTAPAVAPTPATAPPQAPAQP